MSALLSSPLSIIGIDEAGRGAWAGPVVASAVCMPWPPKGVRDSKVLSSKQRDVLYDLITAEAIFGVGVVSATEIDKIGIKGATNLAMRQALEQVFAALEDTYPLVLIDGNDKFTFPVPHQSFVRGDGYITSVGCASIIAKVHRDRLMAAHDDTHGVYEFGRHKGYGTKLHQEALAKHGPCPLHRMSYAPLRQRTLAA